MKPPTTAQQKGFTFAPMPFAIISTFSSSYIIWYLLCKERHRLERLYHRLVLAMNFALLPLSIIFVWGNFAVPRGTPDYYGASGTIKTCTASGFIYLVSVLAVPTYYVSLGLQACMGIKNKFKEDKYRWIEKYVHLIAWGIPFACAITVAATENFNPSGTGCYVVKSPRWCETDPDVLCQRGSNIAALELSLGLGLIFLYLIFPPPLVIMMYFWVDKLQKRMTGSMGMQRIRDRARKNMMKNVAVQISVYLLSFWFTWILSLVSAAYLTLEREMLYNLTILGNCLSASKGFVFAMVYFLLQKLGKPNVECMLNASSGHDGQPGLTVQDIRSNAEKTDQSCSEMADERRDRLVSFGNIFDGVPDVDSPWARFIDQDDSDGDDAPVPGEGDIALTNEDIDPPTA